MTTTFDLTGEHLAALAVIAAAGAALCLAARRWPGPWIGPATAGLGVGLVLSETVWIAWLLAGRAWTPAVGLPLHICDAATGLGAAALWTRRRVLVELLYFWAGAGTLQALVTPDLPQHFPSILYFQYYAAHGGIVVAALLLVWGLRITPGRGAVGRALLLTIAYVAVVGAVDAVTGGDYIYLRRPPSAPTLLDLMGPWPWYLAAAGALGVVLFVLLDAPFQLARRAAALPPGDG